MALKVYDRNVDAVNKAAAQYSSQKEENQTVNIYRFKQGKTTIRVMQPWNDQGVWYREFQEHQVQIGKRWVFSTCARQFGSACVICEAGEEIYKAGGEDNIKRASDYRPKRQFLINAIVLADPEGDQRSKGIVPIKTGITVLRALLGFDSQPVGDEGFGDITSLTHGFNLSVELSSDKKYTVMPSRSRTNIVELLAKDNMDVMSFTVHDLDVLAPPDSPDELRAILEGADRVPGFPMNPTRTTTRVVGEGTLTEKFTAVSSSVPTPVMPNRPDFND